MIYTQHPQKPTCFPSSLYDTELLLEEDFQQWWSLGKVCPFLRTLPEELPGVTNFRHCWDQKRLFIYPSYMGRAVFCFCPCLCFNKHSITNYEVIFLNKHSENVYLEGLFLTEQVVCVPAFQKWQDLLGKHAKSRCQQRGEVQPRGAGPREGRWMMSTEKTVWKGLVRHGLTCFVVCARLFSKPLGASASGDY